MKKLILFLLLAATTAEGQTTRTETKYVSVTPTVTAGAYTAKDSVGGLMTFANISCNNRAKGRISSVMIADKADNASEYDVVLFKSLPGGTFTNDAAFDPSDADLLLMLPVINLATTDHFSFNDNGISSLSSLNSGAVATQTEGLPGTIYAAIVARGTALPTYASTSDVTLTLGFTCD